MLKYILCVFIALQSILAISQKTIYISANAEGIIPDKIEIGSSIGIDFNNTWSSAITYQRGLLGYNYMGIEECRYFRAMLPYRYIGFGAKLGAFDSYYLNFRPFVRAKYLLNDDFTFIMDATVRAFAADISLQIAYNIFKQHKHPASY